MRDNTTMLAIRTIVLTFISILLSACNSEIPIEPKPVNIIQLQHHWELTHIDNIRLATVINSSLIIDDDYNSFGNLGCNNFRGEVQVNNNKLNITNMGKSLKHCSEIQNSVEKDVISVLRGTANIMVDNRTLIISNDQHSLTYYLAKESI